MGQRCKLHLLTRHCILLITNSLPTQTQIPSAGESYPTSKSPCPWFEYISASLAMSPLQPHMAVVNAEVDLSSFNPQVLPSSNSPMVLVNPSKSITTLNNDEDVLVLRSPSTPSLCSSSDSDNSSYSSSSSSVSSSSTPPTPLNLDNTPLPLVDVKPSASSVAVDSKFSGDEATPSLTISSRRTVAWWRF